MKEVDGKEALTYVQVLQLQFVGSHHASETQVS
jgi:hypothetical protein